MSDPKRDPSSVVSNSNHDKLSLLVHPDLLTVCKLGPDAAIPSWAVESLSATTGSSSFSFFTSITRTREELSIVCPQVHVSETITANAHNKQQNLILEKDWITFQVEGILEFGWTGILARIANPLAQAGISIFAVSTYNTDYILVQQRHLDAAVEILERKQQFVVTYLTSSSDRVATSFLHDPLVQPLKKSSADHYDGGWPETFGLVVVAGWPPSAQLQQDYQQQVVPLLKACFASSDLEHAAYIYPSCVLHVTLATLLPFFHKSRHTLEQQATLCQHSKALVQCAWDEWKKQSANAVTMTLELHGIQLGHKAAILLWKDSSGQLRKFRHILKQQTLKHDSDGDGKNETTTRAFSETTSIPDIIHTTVLRFAQVPQQDDGAAIQEKFQQQLLLKKHQLLKLSWPIDSLSLVCERRPYMHIPDDDHHVLCRLDLNSCS